VHKKVVLRTGGTIDITLAIPVRADPSPTKRPKILPAEIVEKKPKLLIVGAFPPKNATIFGGIVTTSKMLLNSEFSEQFDLVLIDSTQHSNPPPCFLIRSVFAIRRFNQYLIKLFTRSPDAVLLFTAAGASAFEKGIMARFARLLGIPVFLFPRGGKLIDAANETALQRMWIKLAMRGATHLLCQGPAWHRFAVDILGFDPAQAPIVHNWSATPQLLRIGAEHELPPFGSVPRILFLGWLEKEKGVFELLEACKTLADRHSFVLLIAGRGHAEPAAKKFVQTHSLKNQVQFVGWVDGEKKESLLRNSDTTPSASTSRRSMRQTWSRSLS
jgi:glycosyltransferase involved in cell wall biosynthesis